MSRTYFVDWSRWQGQLNSRELLRAGFAGAWLKVSGAKPTSAKPFDPTHVDPFWFGNAQDLMATPELLRGAFHYLVPGYEAQQAMVFYGALRMLGGPGGWMCELDVEEPGLNANSLGAFISVWNRLTYSYPLCIYTRKNFWETSIRGAIPGQLHSARWVDSTVRQDPLKPYASQQASALALDAFSEYGGAKPLMVQFSDNVLPYANGPRCDASVSYYSKEAIEDLLVRSYDTDAL